MAVWLHDNAPRGSGLGVTDEPGKFLYDGYEIHGVVTPDDVVRTGVDYVLLSTKQIRAGYTPGGAELRAWLQGHGALAFVSEGPSYERMELYRVGGPVATAAAPDAPPGSPLPGGDLPWVLVPVAIVTGLVALRLLRLRAPGGEDGPGVPSVGIVAATACVGALALLIVSAVLPSSSPSLVGSPIDAPARSGLPAASAPSSVSPGATVSPAP